jgi:RHS repeat-associated protein
MVSSDHSSQGVTTYRYNHANQRIYMKTGTKISYFLYGLGGERLLEMEEQCGGNCWNYQETQRWIYFAGRKMFSKTGTTLKAITPNRLASEAKHFPYGETDGTPPSDTKDYFATYRRDGTGLDYAWNRYYSPTMGRFTTADPYGGSANAGNPQSWNRYSYVDDDPVSFSDPLGLQKCGDRILLDAANNIIGTMESVVRADTEWGIFSSAIFLESRVGIDDAASNEKSLIAGVIMNRYQIVNGYYWIYNSARSGYPIAVSPDWKTGDGKL